MHQPRFNADPRMTRAATWVLAAGFVAMVCGLVLYVSRLAMAFGAESMLSDGLTETLLDGLYIALVLGIGVGYAGLGLLYDKTLCYAVTGLRLYFVLDLYLLGFATGESLIMALGFMLLLKGLEIAALVMLFRAGEHRWLFLAVLVLLALRLVLDFIPGEAFSAIVGLIGTTLYAAICGLGVLTARRASGA